MQATHSSYPRFTHSLEALLLCAGRRACINGKGMDCSHTRGECDGSGDEFDDSDKDRLSSLLDVRALFPDTTTISSMEHTLLKSTGVFNSSLSLLFGALFCRKKCFRVNLLLYFYGCTFVFPLDSNETLKRCVCTDSCKVSENAI